MLKKAEILSRLDPMILVGKCVSSGILLSDMNGYFWPLGAQFYPPFWSAHFTHFRHSTTHETTQRGPQSASF